MAGVEDDPVIPSQLQLQLISPDLFCLPIIRFQSDPQAASRLKKRNAQATNAFTGVRTAANNSTKSMTRTSHTARTEHKTAHGFVSATVFYMSGHYRLKSLPKNTGQNGDGSSK